MDRNNALPDLSTDFHAHILPGCDHGCDHPDTARRQLTMARAARIETVCATPHFYPNRETAASFLERREDSASSLKDVIEAQDPRILLGAEVLICDGLERMEELPLLCLEGSEELLLELPFYRWTGNIWQTIFALQERKDIRIVIAHADRYEPGDIERLIRAGIPLQLNAGCLTHPLRRRRYLSWIREGAVRYLGSDIHMLGSGYRDWEKSRAVLEKYL